MFQSVCPEYVPPKTTRTYICEFFLDYAGVDHYFGNSMHVFLLNLKNITFGALIPKGKYVTLVLLGEDIDYKIVESFLTTELVKSLIPGNIKLEEVTPCVCAPLINITGAKRPFSDRVVLIGDCASSKLYKNGIGAAYLTARAAAKAAIFEGISGIDLQNSYYKVCKELDRDNWIGKFIFQVTKIIQRSAILKYGIFRKVLNEQTKEGEKRYLSSVLWDTFTGSATYTSIFVRLINPLFILSLLWNILLGNLNREKFKIYEK